MTALIPVVLLVSPAWAHDSGFGLVRYLPDGSLDRSFGNNGAVVIRSGQSSFVANTLALQLDGNVVLAGLTSDVTTGTIQLALARFRSDGMPDLGFGAGGTVSTRVGEAGGQANALTVQPDGMIVVAGTVFSHGGPDRFLVARYTPAGALDSTFGTSGTTSTTVGIGASSASAVTLDKDGHILVVGTAFSNGDTDDDFALVRYTLAGQLDQSFGQAGVVTTDFSDGQSGVSTSVDHASAVELQPDARIIVGGFTRGQSQSFAVARYQPNGALDATFGRGGKVQVPAREPQVSSMVLEPSGDIVLAGSSVSIDRGTAPFALVRVHSDGSRDAAFGASGLVTTAFTGSRSGARVVIAGPDGKLISGGAKFGAPSASGDVLPDSGFALARYNPDGSLDTSFGADGRTVSTLGDAGATPLALAVQPDGKILAAGLVFFQVASGPSMSLIARPALLAVGIVLCTLLSVVIVRRARLRTRAAS
ncbi:MAG: hypothetical protein JOZ87_07235 [Chloroflexi bacterium]|nr:hypothetical protein [Chloroflexota bacterium]